jgi:Tfp pilus assembly protein PilE
MFRYLMIAVLLVSCCAGFACQPYTKSLEQSVSRADEVGAIAALHTIVLAQRTYSISNNGSFGTFPQLVKAGALDQRFDAETPKLKGYVLAMAVTAKGTGAGEDSFTLSADPEGPGREPGRHFFVDSSGMIHANATQPATAIDPPVSQ